MTTTADRGWRLPALAAAALAGPLSLAPAAAADEQVTLLPAAGPSGTVVQLTGRAFPAGRLVEVRAARKLLARARADGRGGFSASLIPAGGERLVSTSGRGRVTNVFTRSSRAAVAEVASSSGRRLRWGPFATQRGATIRLAGFGFRANERVRVSLFGRVSRLRASRRGRVRLTLTAPRRTGLLRGAARAGGVSLPLSVTIGAGGSEPPAGPPPGTPSIEVSLPPPSAPPSSGVSAPPPSGNPPNPPPPAPTLPKAVMAASGDIACDPDMLPDFLGTPTRCRHRQTSDLLLDPKIDAVMPLGDLQYEEGTLDQFMRSYDPSWGRVKAITRPVVGNHEYLTPGAAGYFDYFNGAGGLEGPAGRRGQGYYAFDLGRWRWYVLNSNCSQAGGCGLTRPQVTWLRDDLQANPRACVGAAWHHPRFSQSPSADNSTYEPFWQVLYEAGAEVVLVAHDHNYQRYVPIGLNGAPDPARGLRQFVVGNGGRNLQGIAARTDALRVAENGHTFGVLELTMRPTGYDWDFIPEAGKTYTDHGSAACH